MNEEYAAMEFSAWIRQRYGQNVDWDWCRRNYSALVKQYGKPAPLMMPHPSFAASASDNRYDELD